MTVDGKDVKRWAKALALGVAVAVFAAIAAGALCALVAYFGFLRSADSIEIVLFTVISPLVALALLAWGFMVGFFAFLFALSRL
jgi:hypothetical protein